jgi:hypothetical protein
MSRDFGPQEMHEVNFQPDPAQWVEATSWKIASILTKNFPVRNVFISYEPEGVSYNWIGLELDVNGRIHDIRINRGGGSIHLMNVEHTPDELAGPAVWYRCLSKRGLEEVVALIFRTLGAERKRGLTSNRLTLSLRLISQILFMQLDDERSWDCTDSAIHYSPYLNVPEGAPRHVKGTPDECLDKLHQTFVIRCDDQPVAFIHDGNMWIDGVKTDFHTEYQKGSSLAMIGAKVKGKAHDA